MENSHKNHRLEPVAQLEPNFGGMVLGWPPTKIVSTGSRQEDFYVSFP
jgi:hypothetical protein